MKNVGKFIGNIGLAGIVLGAVSLSGCAIESSHEAEPPIRGIEITPAVTEGPYNGMGYVILNEQIAREQRTNSYIEIRDTNSKRTLRVIYEANGSVKNIEGSLPYFPEAIEQIMKRDTAFKSNLWIKIK